MLDRIRFAALAGVLVFSAACSCGTTPKPNGTGPHLDGGNGDGGKGDGGGGAGDGGGGTGDAGADGGYKGCGLRTCTSAGANCGLIGDGCGNQIDCGTCTSPQTCGGGGTPSVCGGTAGCVPLTACPAGLDCGVLADGCGGTINCGTCSTGFCGGGGPNKCGTGTTSDGGTAGCVPQGCGSANCGQVADGCGGLTASCGTCQSPDICGGSGVPNVCGHTQTVDGGVTCTNWCPATCSGGATTTITGTVYAPNGVDPLYNALVYVPDTAVAAFTPGVACETCQSTVSGNPVVSTNTAPDGTFTLTGTPAGANVPLVIQLGRWRRQVTIPTVTACTSNAVAATLTRMPKNKSEGDIPLTAMVTGNVDAMECVLLKMGLDQAEFGNPSTAPGAPRIQFFQANGAVIDGNTPVNDPQGGASGALTGSSTTLDNYDMTIFGCEGSQIDKTGGDLTNLLNYANVGGRVFATHYSYTWLYSPSTWQSAANWNVNQWFGNTTTGYINTTFPKGQAFSTWLGNPAINGLSGANQISIDQPRWDVDSVVAPTQEWINAQHNGGTPVEHLTFNTPVGAPPAQQCGRVLFSDFHVTNANSTNGTTFPNECSSGAMTPQEHVLEFMLFDLASCVAPDVPVCYPKTCAQLGIGCGLADDGCGNTITCPTCPSGQTCGGGGVPSQCGAPTCTPLTCQQQGIQCGTAGDGCGGTIQCPSCPSGQTCGGGGYGICGGTSCVPLTQCPAGLNCGSYADGCGGVIDCGTCPSGQTCGGGGKPNVCGSFG